MSKLEITDCRKEVIAFAIEMERTLRLNDHKPGWGRSPNTYLIRKIAEKFAELLKVDEKGIYPELEAIDIANFAMMYYDNNYLMYQKEE